MDEVESHAAEVLEKLLREIPALKLKSIQIGSKARDTGIDIRMRAEVSGKPHLLVCEVKQSGHYRACQEARPDPAELARRLFERELRSDFDVFYGSAARYAKTKRSRTIKRISGFSLKFAKSSAGTMPMSMKTSLPMRVSDK